MKKEEFEDWFELKQMLANLILQDLKEDWEAGNIPSSARKIYEMNSVMSEIIKQSFSYLKELGEIYIIPNKENNTDLILERNILKKMGIRFDQSKKE